jgi:hypothetical protein
MPKKGQSDVFMEMAVIIIVLAVVGFMISQTLLRTTPPANSLSGNSEEVERQLASKIASCWAQNSAKSSWQACSDLPTSSVNISTENVESLAKCDCKVKWSIESNFTKTLINYDGFNRQVRVDMVREQ